ncbi:hypothetical protein [Desulfitobacterium sp. LBE]|uniref:hypothetical protein n=1 Tax=Desulfitobacterium sp. LBE TaxID=884086 RepID=UPI00155A79E1|nr:hypothetical protein [Desulfitobacterium sp. LBE]
MVAAILALMQMATFRLSARWVILQAAMLFSQVVTSPFQTAPLWAKSVREAPVPAVADTAFTPKMAALPSTAQQVMFQADPVEFTQWAAMFSSTAQQVTSAVQRDHFQMTPPFAQKLALPSTAQ